MAAEEIVKYAVNDSLGRPNFMSIDKMLSVQSHDMYYRTIRALANSGNAAFDGLGYVSDGATTVNESQFYGTTKKEIAIPSSVRTIQNDAFYNGAIESIVLPPLLKSIGDSAFHGTKLRSIVVPDGVTMIASDAFSGSLITSCWLPYTLERLNPLFRGGNITKINYSGTNSMFAELINRSGTAWKEEFTVSVHCADGAVFTYENGELVDFVQPIGE